MKPFSRCIRRCGRRTGVLRVGPVFRMGHGYVFVQFPSRLTPRHTNNLQCSGQSVDKNWTSWSSHHLMAPASVVSISGQERPMYPNVLITLPDKAQTPLESQWLRNISIGPCLICCGIYIFSIFSKESKPLEYKITNPRFPLSFSKGAFGCYGFPC